MQLLLVVLNSLQLVLSLLHQATKLVIDQELVSVWSMVYAAQLQAHYALLGIKVLLRIQK